MVGLVSERQHRISEWYLRAFAHQTPASGPRLATYNKRTAHFAEEYPARFLARRGDHSVEIERALAEIEGPAARAATASRHSATAAAM